jgi:hypothetical protein
MDAAEASGVSVLSLKSLIEQYFTYTCIKP